MNVNKSPGWVRAAQIGLGIVILILSIIVLINPIVGTISVIFIIALLLLFAGIEKVISGLFAAGKSRLISIGLGIVVIIISLVALAYPVAAGIFVVLLIAVALLVDGISRVVHGIKDKQSKRWSKSFLVGAGILSIIFAIAILVYPGIGLVFAGILIGITLLVTSIQIISAGVSGEQRRGKEV